MTKPFAKVHGVPEPAQWLLAVLGLGLIAMVCLTVFNVIGRYIFSSAILWADEVAIFAMIALTWLGAIVSAWRGQEIRIDLLLTALSPRARLALVRFQLLTTTVFLGWITWLSYTYVARIFQFGMRSDSAAIPLWTIHSTITLSLAAMTFIALFRLLRLLAAPTASEPPQSWELRE